MTINELHAICAREIAKGNGDYEVGIHGRNDDGPWVPGKVEVEDDFEIVHLHCDLNDPPRPSTPADSNARQDAYWRRVGGHD